jgi:hypothetical protein
MRSRSWDCSTTPSSTIIGDNGASAEGTLQGTFNELISLNGMAELETAEFLRSCLDSWGGPESAPHYAVGWAHAMCTPYQWTKQVASHWGGTRNGTIVHWPGGIEATGELRHQFHHVIDVAPTVLEATGIPEPTLVHGITQEPMHGVSMLDSFDDADAPERRETQYFEMFGNRGIYHEGWSAVTKHRTPWQTVGNVGIAFDDDVWELYDGSADWTQARDLSKANPTKLHGLQRLFLIEATRYQVLPLDHRSFERVLPEISGKPELITGKKQILLPGMGGLTELHIVNIRNKSWSLTAQLQIPDSGASGALLKLGGHAGGLSFYLKDGKPAFCYNLFGIDHTYIRSENPVPTGEHQVRVEFACDGGGLGKGGDVSLYVDGDQSLCRLSSCSPRSGWASSRANCEPRDLARREDPQRWSPETGAPARVELGPLTVPAEALDDRLVEAHQVVERPDLPTVGVPGDL